MCELVRQREHGATRLSTWVKAASVLVTVKDLAQEGMTCILVTHEMGFAREIADHIYFTGRGVIVEHGPPATFFAEAKDPRTKEFLSQIF